LEVGKGRWRWKIGATDALTLATLTNNSHQLLNNCTYRVEVEGGLRCRGGGVDTQSRAHKNEDTQDTQSRAHMNEIIARTRACTHTHTSFLIAAQNSLLSRPPDLSASSFCVGKGGNGDGAGI